jgi:hypothetical protein
MTKRETRRIEYQAQLKADREYSHRDRCSEYLTKVEKAIAEGNIQDAGFWACWSASWVLNHNPDLKPGV